ncbi:MAG: histidinol dehydrogenase [Clostridiales bacterium]|nr:histidinol dehydrogenase [Clostridiales bacterium]
MQIINYNKPGGREMLDKVLSRARLDYTDAPAVVSKIIEDVKFGGDAALLKYTHKFDCDFINETNILVTKDEINEAYGLIDKNLAEIIKKSAKRIEDFHSRQKKSSWFDTYENGEILGQMVLPLDKVGVYVPGGKAAYPSSVLMSLIPASVAGVKNIIMCTPPGKDGKINPAILVAASVAGAGKIFKAGGAQAIAAMAFGTGSVPKVDKIVGPGNIYVALAKRYVFGFVNIDSVAGPSDILVIADKSANAKYVAADLLSQAEHDELAAAVLVTPCEELAFAVNAEFEKMLEKTPRSEIAKVSAQNNGAIIVVNTIEEAFEISNKIAPEHLEICVSDAFSMLPYVKNAGAVFLGNYSPEPLGDYIAGPNHVLPTGGTARFFSPLNIDDFTKKTSILHFDKKSFESLADDCITFAESEGLFAHADSIRARFL